MPKIKMLRPLELNENLPPEKAEMMRATDRALRWLAENFPAAFPDHTKKLRPLAIGVHEQLEKILSSAPDTVSSAPDMPSVLRALERWTASPQYLSVLAMGKVRVNLDGTLTTMPKPSHQERAVQLLELRRARKRAAKAPTPNPKPIAPPRVPTRPVIKLRRATA